MASFVICYSSLVFEFAYCSTELNRTITNDE
jgi:hypothetical protein